MSGYFDGLMRASGLPLGAAPVIGPAARTLQGLDLAQTPPVAGVPAATPQAPSVPLAAGPARGVASRAPQQPEAFARTGLPRALEPTALARPPQRADEAPLAGPSEAEPPIAQTPAQTRTAPALRAPASTVAFPVAFPAAATASAPQPGISREKLIQAAMRWVAAEPAPVPPQPMRVAVAGASPVTQRSPGTAAWAVPKAETSKAAEVPIAAQAPRAAAAELLPTRPHAPQQLTPPQPAPDVGLQVSIGAIHLRVDAPQAPALQAAAAPHPSAPPPAAASSGLSRRALRRL